MDKEALQLLRCASPELNKRCCHRLQVEGRGLQHQLQVSTNRMTEANDSGDKVAISWAKQALDKATTAMGTEQIRLFFFLVYTDDPIRVTVGPDHMSKSLKLWHWFTSGAQFMMAVSEKRSLGTSGRWLGIHFLAQLGICDVPAQKIPRACSSIDLIRSQSMSFSDY